MRILSSGVFLLLLASPLSVNADGYWEHDERDARYESHMNGYEYPGYENPGYETSYPERTRSRYSSMDFDDSYQPATPRWDDDEPEHADKHKETPPNPENRKETSTDTLAKSSRTSKETSDKNRSGDNNDYVDYQYREPVYHARRSRTTSVRQSSQLSPYYKQFNLFEDDKTKHIPRNSSSGKRRSSQIRLRGTQIMQLSGKRCYRMLAKHGVRFRKVRYARGVRYPVRVTSRLGGVVYRHTGNKARYSIMDCRLALALTAWSQVLQRYGVYEVVHMRTYAPGAVIRNTGKRSSHSNALSIDVARFKTRKYGTLDVKHNWYDRTRGLPPCDYVTPEAGVLRSIVCATAKSRLFAVILTPHFNRDHHDHFHIEVKPNRNTVVLR